jgi:hypothetical protein
MVDGGKCNHMSNEEIHVYWNRQGVGGGAVAGSTSAYAHIQIILYTHLIAGGHLCIRQQPHTRLFPAHLHCMYH